MAAEALALLRRVNHPPRGFIRIAPRSVEIPGSKIQPMGPCVITQRRFVKSAVSLEQIRLTHHAGTKHPTDRCADCLALARYGINSVAKTPAVTVPRKFERLPFHLGCAMQRLRHRRACIPCRLRLVA